MMTRRIFRAVLGISFVGCLAGMVIAFAVLYSYFDGQLSKELKNEAEYLAVSLENYGDGVLEELPASSERVTLIDTDGTVLFDNYFDPAAMDNHADREEIRQAMLTGSARAVRQSYTFQKQFMDHLFYPDGGRAVCCAHLPQDCRTAQPVGSGAPGKQRVL